MIRCGGAAQSSDLGRQPANSLILCRDRLVRGAKLAFAIGELDFCGLTAPLGFVQCAAHRARTRARLGNRLGRNPTMWC
jgi:hypothetical protein